MKDIISLLFRRTKRPGKSRCPHSEPSPPDTVPSCIQRGFMIPDVLRHIKGPPESPLQLPRGLSVDDPAHITVSVYPLGNVNSYSPEFKSLELQYLKIIDLTHTNLVSSLIHIFLHGSNELWVNNNEPFLKDCN